MVDWRGNGVIRPLSLDFQGVMEDEPEQEGTAQATRVSEAAARKATLSRRVRRGVLLERFANTCHEPAGSSVGGQFCETEGGRTESPSASVAGSDTWIADHGISRSVYEGRPYGEWEQSASNSVRDIPESLEAEYGDSPVLTKQMAKVAGQSGGIIMERHPAPESPYGDIYAEVRPDEAVIMDHRQPAAKYVFPAGEGNAARVDVHPQAVESLVNGKGRVYLAMEGCLKADAVLTELKNTGALDRGETVISVPSVTLWHTGEMGWVAKNYLQGREIVLIADADGVDNPMVRNQARLLQATLGSYGTGRVVAAAPPLKNGKIEEVVLPSGKKDKRKGVDDHIGAGGKLEDMTFVDRTVPKVEISEDKFGGSVKSAITASRVMGIISHIAGPEGRVRLSQRNIASAVGMSKSGVDKVLENLEEAGLIKTDVHATWGKNDSYVNIFANDTPLITLVGEGKKFLASDGDERRVATLAGAGFYGQSIGEVIKADEGAI